MYINNFSNIKPENRLYTPSESLIQAPEINEPYVINMISMIGKDTLPAHFKKAWKQNESYRPNMGCRLLNCSSKTGLHWAVEIQNLEMTKYFIKKLGENIDLLDGNNHTPLQNALISIEAFGYCSIQMEIIKQLLKGGADVNLALKASTRNNHFSLLRIAVRYPELTSLLMQYGAQKLHAFAPDRKSIIKEQFSQIEKDLYAAEIILHKQSKKKIVHKKKESSNQHRINQAKKEITYCQALFNFGFQDPGSIISYLPKEIIAHILTQEPLNPKSKSPIKSSI